MKFLSCKYVVSCVAMHVQCILKIIKKDFGKFFSQMGKGSCIFYVGEKFNGYFTLIWAYGII